MTTIVYLHGFASTGDSDKSRAIRERFPDCTVLAPDLSPNCGAEIIKLLSDNPSKKYVFVGTSLGGFWANVFAHVTGFSAVLVNPSITPSVSLKGAVAKNYKTGDLVTVTDTDINDIKAAEHLISHLYTGKLVSLFLATDDDVIPWEPTLKALKGYDSVLITKDGGHRYALHWDKVLDKVAELI
jgi:predicted esterase YcpF (UPF0227 family)